MYNTWPKGQNGRGVPWTDVLFFLDKQGKFVIFDYQSKIVKFSEKNLIMDAF